MTISKALKKLYTAMCGGTTNKTTAGDLINEIADDYAGGGGGGGGGDEYETVLEMQLGEPITGEGIPEWATAFDVSDYETEIRSLTDERIPIFISSNSYKHGEKIELAYHDENWTKNCTASAQGITWDNPNEDCFVLAGVGFIFGSNVNFSNTTVTILKKVSGGGSSLPDPGAVGNVLTSTGDGWESAAPQGGDNDYIIEGDLIIDGDLPRAGEIQVNVSELDEAIAANKNIKLVLSCSTPIDAVFVLPFVESASNSGYFFMGACDYNFATYIARMYIDRTDTTNQSFLTDRVPTIPAFFRYDYAVTESGGTYTVTGEGTYQNIAAALSQTLNVYARIDGFLSNENLIARFCRAGETRVAAESVCLDGAAVKLIGLYVNENGTKDFLVKTLTSSN